MLWLIMLFLVRYGACVILHLAIIIYLRHTPLMKDIFVEFPTDPETSTLKR